MAPGGAGAGGKAGGVWVQDDEIAYTEAVLGGSIR